MNGDAEQSGAPVYYPAFLDLHGKCCVVVGGGQVARRKVEGLLVAGAAVTVIAPHIAPMPGGVTLYERPYAAGDLDGAVLVIAATDDSVVNAEVAHEAERRGIWVNVVDDPERGSFIAPAVLRRDGLQIAVSTAGASPILARRLRDELAERYDAAYGELAALLRRLRREWEPRAIAADVPAAARRRAWEAVLDLPLLELLRAGKCEEAEAAASNILCDAISPKG